MPAARPDAAHFSDYELTALFAPVLQDRHIAIAVSGGSDSMALLRLAARLPAGKISVLTVDHGLREGTAAEAEFVAGAARQLALPHAMLPWTGAKPATGIQAAARQARYDLMTEWCVAHGVSCLLTGHTLDDQAETVLMRLARTSSLDSLSGIPAIGHWREIRLFRPLLGLRREALRELLRSLGQQWIDDPSNGDERFERVRIRKAMPVLQALGITAEALAELAYRVSEAVQGLWGATDDWVRLHVRKFETAHCTVPLEAFIDQTEALKSRILGWLISRYGSGKMPEPAELELLSAWVDGGGSRRTLGGAIVARRKDHLLIGREPGRIDHTPVPVPDTGHLVWDRRFAIEAPRGSQVVPVAALKDVPRRADIPSFVQQALPAILSCGNILAIPHLGIGSGASAKATDGPGG